jgi:hypothetical protein
MPARSPGLLAAELAEHAEEPNSDKTATKANAADIVVMKNGDLLVASLRLVPVSVVMTIHLLQ